MFKTPPKKIHPKTTYYITPLMQEIRLTSWYGKYPVIHRVSYLSGGDRQISEPSRVFQYFPEISWALQRSPRHWSLHKQASPCHNCWWAGFQVDLLYLWGVFFDGKIHQDVFLGWWTTKHWEIENECFTIEVFMHIMLIVSIQHQVIAFLPWLFFIWDLQI